MLSRIAALTLAMVNGFAGGTCASSSDFDGDGWSGEGEPYGEFSSQESELRRENDHGSSEDMATVRGKVIEGEPWLSAQRARARSTPRRLASGPSSSLFWL